MLQGSLKRGEDMKKAVIHPDKWCRACGCCVRAYPEGLLKLGLDSVIVSDKCVGCGTCTKACPFHALVLTGGEDDESE